MFAILKLFSIIISVTAQNFKNGRKSLSFFLIIAAFQSDTSRLPLTDFH